MKRGLLLAMMFGIFGLGVGCIFVEEDPGPDPGPAPGPVDPGPELPPPSVSVSCGHFDPFLYDCTDNCGPTWDCELQYDSLSYGDQYTLDSCALCLADNLAAGICADCAVVEDGYDVGSCQDFMESLLGMDCW